MIDEILAFWAPGILELIVIAIISLVVFLVPVALIIFLVLYFVQSNKEKLKLRMEVEKLAEEVRKLRLKRNSK